MINVIFQMPEILPAITVTLRNGGLPPDTEEVKKVNARLDFYFFYFLKKNVALFFMSNYICSKFL